MGWDGLIGADVAARLAAAREGQDVSRRLALGTLEPGIVGVVEAEVVHVAPMRSFQRNGRDGTVGRVTLRDATGEADLVLWNEETALARDGPLQPRRHVRIRGASVRDGFRGGAPELALGAAVVEPLDAPSGDATLEGTITLGATVPVGPPEALRFQAQATIESSDGSCHLVLWDDGVRAAQGLDTVRITGLARHPSLDGWYLWTPQARLAPL